MRRISLAAALAAIAVSFGCNSACNSSAPAPGPKNTNTATTSPNTNGPGATNPTKPGDPPPPLKPINPETQVTDIPDYPNGTRVGTFEAPPAPKFSKGVMVEYTTSDGIEAVKTYYKDVFAKNGWSIGLASLLPQRTMWQVTKGASGAMIEIMPKEGGSTIKVTRYE